MFPGCISANRVRVKLTPLEPGPEYVNGVLCGANFVYATLSSGPAEPYVVVNGIPVTPQGRLLLAGGATRTYSNGLPIMGDGNAVHRQTADATHYSNGLPFNGDRLAVEELL
jgi:hypothetical protein